MKKILTFSLFFFTLSTVQAGLLVEPWLGYNLATSGKATTPGGEALDFEYGSPALGGKLAYTRLGLQIGTDIAYQSFSLETDSSDSTMKDDFKRTDIFVFAGVELPLLIRGWFKYLVSSSFKGGNGNHWARNSKFTGSSGYAIGIGYTGFPMVSLNVEYKKMSWDKHNNVKFNKDLKLSEMLFSVSLPLNF